MFKFVVLLCLAAFGLCDEVQIGFRSTERLAHDYPLHSCKVVNGQDAKEGEFPYQVSVQLKSKKMHFCGGSILNDRVILTAAHCIHPNYINNPKELQVAAGITKLSTPGTHTQIIGAKKCIKHKKYFGGVQPYDIGVIILESPLKFDSHVQPITLPEAGATFTGDVVLTGWGSISNTTTPIYPDCLQKATVPLLTHKECSNAWSSSPLDEFSNVCSGPVGGNLAACSGDSGGPLVKNVNGKKVQVGIVSWGSIPCGRGMPSVYTKVASFIDFINDSMAQAY